MRSFSGKVLDVTGTPPAQADVVIEHARIVVAGPGLDGDTLIDCTDRASLPGLTGSHVHVNVDLAAGAAGVGDRVRAVDQGSLVVSSECSGTESW